MDKESDESSQKNEHGAYITPDGERQVESPSGHGGEDASSTRSAGSPRRVLFPASPERKSNVKLRDTFIGTANADELVQQGIPEELTIFNSANGNEPEGGPCSSERVLCYSDSKTRDPRELFCYYWKTSNTVNLSSTSTDREMKPLVLDLFAGAGGMSQGLQQAGLNVRWAVEHERCAVDTLRSNHKHTVVFHQDIYKFLTELENQQKQSSSGLFEHVVTAHGMVLNKVDHIHASPPCQGFSTAKRYSSNRSTQIDKDRNKLIYTFIQGVRILQPSTASLENVEGLLQSRHKHYLQKVVADLLLLGYSVRGMLLDAGDFETPQRRNRVILLAAKGVLLPRIPKATIPVTVKKAFDQIDSVAPSEPGIPSIVKRRRTNHNLSRSDGEEETSSSTFDVLYDHHVKEMRCGCDVLSPHGVAQTVTRINRIAHPSSERELTVRERAQLQAFPLNYHFCGDPQAQCDQIGNAVPVTLAEAIGKSILEAYNS